MDDKSLWGLLLLIYIVPFWLWQMSRESTIEISKQLYSGRESVDRQERRFNNLSLLWSIGLIVILATWKAGWHPISAAIILFGTILLIFLARVVSKHWSPMSNRSFRIWLAVTALWLLSMVSWYLTIGRLSYLHDEEYFFLFMPPALLGLALAAWRWATSKP